MPLIRVISSFSTVALLFRVTAGLPAPVAFGPAALRLTRTRHLGQTTISDIVPGSSRSLFGPVILPRVLAVAVDAAGSDQLHLAECRQGSQCEPMTFSPSDVSLPLFFFLWLERSHGSSVRSYFTHTHKYTHCSEFLPISSVNLFISALIHIWSDLIWSDSPQELREPLQSDNRQQDSPPIRSLCSDCVICGVQQPVLGVNFLASCSCCLSKMQGNLSWFSRNGNKQDEVEITAEKRPETNLLPEMLFQICRPLFFSSWP